MASLSDTKIVPAGDRFDIDVPQSSGLSLRVRGGVLLDGYGFKSVSNATLALTASATHYVEISDIGVISANTSGFTAGATQLYIVTTGASVVTGVADARGSAWVSGALDGAAVANSGNGDVIGGVPVLHRIDITAGALGNTDVTLTHKTRVVDAWLVLRGAGVATTTLQVKNTAAAITDAMAASGADQTVVRAATIDDAAHEIAAGGILRVTSATGASQPAATVYVLGVRVA